MYKYVHIKHPVFKQFWNEFRQNSEFDYTFVK